MKFQTEDENDIKWMADPAQYDVGDVVQKIKDAGKWEQLLQQESNEDGVLDCDALYDRLNHESYEVLASVGLHWTEGTATVMDVVNAWAEKHKDEGLKVSYCADGKTPSGLMLFDYGKRLGTELSFESVDADGEVDGVSLDADEVLELVGDKADGNATAGAWTGIDPETAVFEMWREE